MPLGRYEYRLAWNGIPAASATVDVSRGIEPDASYEVRGEVKTNWLVDLLWSLRANVTARFTPPDLAPLGFVYDRRIRGDPTITEVVFEDGDRGATGTARHAGASRVMAVDAPGVLDPVTAIFRALGEPLEAGETLGYDVFTGEALYRVELYVEREENIVVGGHRYDAWRMQPRLWRSGSGAESRLRQATIWVSRNPARTVLRVRSEVFIGAVTVDLMKFS